MENPDSISPLAYLPELEVPEEDEDETVQSLVETMKKISETTFANSGHAIRSVHAKSHGFLLGDLVILENLPAMLRQGLFEKPGRYPALMRLSTPPGDLLPDSVSTPRGLALKVLGVEGERLPGSESATTQDFVMANGPAFHASTAKAFLSSLKLLAATTDKAVGVKEVISTMMRGTEKVIEAFGAESPKLKSLGGHAETHILGETFYSQVPLRFGDYVAKIAIVPVSPQLKELKDAPVNLDNRPDGLRNAVVAFFDRNDAEWEVRAQICVDQSVMPIEDAAVIWPEDRSPYRTIAQLRVKPQRAWSDARAAAIDDGVSFSPWTGIEAHRPLGSIMRARKAAYAMSVKFRAHHNGHVQSEPTSLQGIP